MSRATESGDGAGNFGRVCGGEKEADRERKRGADGRNSDGMNDGLDKRCITAGTRAVVDVCWCLPSPATSSSPAPHSP